MNEKIVSRQRQLNISSDLIPPSLTRRSSVFDIDRALKDTAKFIKVANATENLNHLG
jgi:hypothetical protein